MRKIPDRVSHNARYLHGWTSRVDYELLVCFLHKTLTAQKRPLLALWRTYHNSVEISKFVYSWGIPFSVTVDKVFNRSRP